MTEPLPPAVSAPCQKSSVPSVRCWPMSRWTSQPGKTWIRWAGGGIEHHSASAVRRPGPPTLLGPYRQLVPCAPVSQPPCAIARGQLGQGKDPDLGGKIGLLEESVFDAEFCIAEARGPSLTRG